MPCFPLTVRTEDKEAQRIDQKTKKNDLKMRIEDILPSTSCLELAVLPVPTGMLLLFLLLLLLLMLISIPVLHLGGCCRFSKKKKERLRCKPASNLGTFMAFGAIDRTLVRLICPHTCKNTHTHTYTSMHKHAAECFSQSSLPPRLPAASKELGIQRDLPETYSYIHTDTQRI